jgi:RimJ/RimL family protein N-acetyltransferase
MIEFLTKRLIAKSDMRVVDSKLVPYETDISDIDILNLLPRTGRESGFLFYDKDNKETLICHIGITLKRSRFEVTYCTIECFRKQGYMTEALSGLVEWIFKNTDVTVIWGIPNGEESQRILERCGFVFYENISDSSLKWFCISNQD